MAENDPDIEKSLPPSERKLEQARESGSGLKAPDLMLVVAFSLACMGLMLEKNAMWGAWQALWKWDDFWSRGSGLNLTAIFHGMSGVMIIVLAVLIVAGASAALMAWGINGFIFSMKAITFDLSRIDPLAKFGEIFSGGGAQIWWPLIKGMGSLGLMVLGVSIFARELSGGGDPVSSMIAAVAPSLVAFVFFALMDFLIQAWKRSKAMGMTLQELKDEMKESEGDPMVKGRMRALARQRAKSRMMTAIASADVVVVNPEHYLVALKWDSKKAAAPLVVARARDLLALAMKDRARELAVPVLEAPPFARALWAASKVDRAIPVEFYGTIAVLLAWSYAVKDGKSVADPIVEPPVGGAERLGEIVDA